MDDPPEAFSSTSLQIKEQKSKSSRSVKRRVKKFLEKKKIKKKKD
jgi:hypothetical protein